jgi:hypothetical protein
MQSCREWLEQPLEWPPVGFYRRFGPEGSLDQRVKLSLCAPAQMGWCEMEHKWENEPCIILHQGARSRGYKRQRVRAREGE